MRRTLFAILAGFVILASAEAQDIQRKVVNVPQIDSSGVLTIDGLMNESVWSTAGQANLITPTGFEIWANKYYREDLTEPDYDEYYARLLWAHDSLYIFIHIDEYVNDSTDLYWDRQWTGDQLFVSLSNRLGVAMQGWYDGNVYAAPDGPYHFLIMADSVTLNVSQPTWIPDEYKRFPDDTVRVFNASDIARWAIQIDTVTGEWDIEMAVYNPHVSAGSAIGFNIGGSTGSYVADTTFGDAYSYYTWQPNVVNNPYADPVGANDPGYYNLAGGTEYWALLNFVPGSSDPVRKVLDVPQIDSSGVLTLDGVMNEWQWQGGAKVNLITPTGFEIWANKYYREDLTEPDYDEYYARLLWAHDSLYIFIHIDEYVNDSTDLYWDRQWTGDQLFVSLSNRLGVAMQGWYDGNVYAAPDGPYHFLIMADSVTLNVSQPTWIPDEYKRFPDDTVRVFNASDIARWAATINMTTGVWNIEMAVYSPNVAPEAAIGFNIGGSTGSYVADTTFGDAYSYYTWQPNVVNNPYADPVGANDPGYYNLAGGTEYWARLNISNSFATSVGENAKGSMPSEFELAQNFPNPFNPETNIRFTLPAAGKVQVVIFNLLGQRVSTLVNRQLPAGKFETTWNASSFGSGVYFYQLLVDDKPVLSRKMVLIK